MTGYLLVATITDQTGVSLGVILAIAGLFGGGLLAGVFWAGATLTRINTSIVRIENIVQDTWTLENQRLWATQLNRDNKGLVVPNVDAIKRGRDNRE